MVPLNTQPGGIFYVSYCQQEKTVLFLVVFPLYNSCGAEDWEVHWWLIDINLNVGIRKQMYFHHFYQTFES